MYIYRKDPVGCTLKEISKIHNGLNCPSYGVAVFLLDADDVDGAPGVPIDDSWSLDEILRVHPELENAHVVDQICSFGTEILRVRL